MIVDQWWDEPDRACTVDYRYSELLLSDGPGTKAERERMARACLACPVYLDCLEGVISGGKAWEYHEIQAEITKTHGDRPARPRDPE